MNLPQAKETIIKSKVDYGENVPKRERLYGTLKSDVEREKKEPEIGDGIIII